MPNLGSVGSKQIMSQPGRKSSNKIYQVDSTNGAQQRQLQKAGKIDSITN